MRRAAIFIAAAIGLFMLLLALELWQSDEPVTWVSLAMDLVELALLASAVGFTALSFVETRAMRHERRVLLRDLALARDEGERWRHAARDYLEGLSRAIGAQFDDWRLSDAERDVALLMLKGLSHKEIAVLRDTSSATVRQHAAAVYRKSGLVNRAQFTGFFLEDLLSPARSRSAGLKVVE